MPRQGKGAAVLSVLTASSSLPGDIGEPCPAVGPKICVCTFGGLSVALEGVACRPALSARQRQLLRWLVLAPWGPPLEVSTVCDAMWSGADGAAASSNFASTVRRLRGLLGGAWSVLVEGGTVRLHPLLCRTDLDILRELPTPAPDTGAIDQAARLARRLLAGFEGGNPVLQARSDCVEMADRVQAVEVAWRHATLHLAEQLHGTMHMALALGLCERIERHGLADERVVALWQRLATASLLPGHRD